MPDAHGIITFFLLVGGGGGGGAGGGRMGGNLSEQLVLGVCCRCRGM